MKYLKNFQKQTDYQSFIESSNFVTPNVSVTTEENLVFYHPFSNTFNLEFNPTVSDSLTYYGCESGEWTKLRYFEEMVNKEISDLISGSFDKYDAKIFETIINNVTNENTVTNPLMGYCDFEYQDVEFMDDVYKDTAPSYTVRLPFFTWYENNNLILVLYKHKYSLSISIEDDYYIDVNANYISESDEIYINCVTGPTPPDGSLEPTQWIYHPIPTVPPITPEANYVINMTLSEEEIALAKEHPYLQFDEEEFYQQLETNGLRNTLDSMLPIFEGDFITTQFDKVLPCNLVHQMLVNEQVDINITYNLTITQKDSVVKTFTEDIVETFFIYFDENFPDEHGSYWLLTKLDRTHGLHAYYNNNGILGSQSWGWGGWC